MDFDKIQNELFAISSRIADLQKEERKHALEYSNNLYARSKIKKKLLEFDIINKEIDKDLNINLSQNIEEEVNKCLYILENGSLDGFEQMDEDPVNDAGSNEFTNDEIEAENQRRSKEKMVLQEQLDSYNEYISDLTHGIRNIKNELYQLAVKFEECKMFDQVLQVYYLNQENVHMVVRHVKVEPKIRSVIENEKEYCLYNGIWYLCKDKSTTGVDKMCSFNQSKRLTSLLKSYK